MNRVSEFLLHRRVQFYEVDSAGIVHFSWFFRYMEEAEHAMWRTAGLSIAMTGSDIGFPRVATSFDYHRPLRFEDEFDVRIQIAAIKAKSIQYSCIVSKGADRIATGALTIACVRKGPQHTMSAIAIPDDIVSRFEVAAEAREST
jgi:YbgC/YbaW family acyl-CoA thioester hydrolase